MKYGLSVMPKETPFHFLEIQ